MIPSAFKERMTALLGADAEAFFAALEQEPVKAFRVNGCKLTPEEFEALAPAIEHSPMGFPHYGYFTSEQYPGALPYHHSGMIYMQDPSAMATVTALTVEEGMLVLDCCAAPGGKSTQLAALVGDRGLVIANEYEGKRAKILQSNAERMGCRNMAVLNLDTAVLAELYPRCFDLVLADAPCSGEGMFRKNSRAGEEWSPQNVAMCAERQREILTNVEKCVKPGGYLLYSTCTFSLEENERNVAWFLENYPAYALCEVSDALRRVTADGILLDGSPSKLDMTKARRFYPHISPGEGQFIALLRHLGEETAAVHLSESGKNKKMRRQEQKRPGREESEAIALAEAFLKENLTSEFFETEHTLALRGQYVYLVPRLALPERGTVMAGVCVGECARGRLIPHHQIFSAYGQVFRRRVLLAPSEQRTADYLRGLEIPLESSDYDCQDSGWAAVLIGNVPVGGGKLSNGVCKNHYPKGLRNQ